MFLTQCHLYKKWKKLKVKNRICYSSLSRENRQQTAARFKTKLWTRSVIQTVWKLWAASGIRTTVVRGLKPVTHSVVPVRTRTRDWKCFVTELKKVLKHFDAETPKYAKFHDTKFCLTFWTRNYFFSFSTPCK